MASNDQKSVLSHHNSTSSASRGQLNVETTIIVSDVCNSINNDNTQVIVTHLPKPSSNTSKGTQQTSKISTSTHSNVQSSSGTMTGVIF